MPLDRDFAIALTSAMTQSGWQTNLPAGILPNPITLSFQKGSKHLLLTVHARPLTAQARFGDDPSSHNRPLGEMHAQMIFDGDQRGAGIVNQLRFFKDSLTVLFGFYGSNQGYIVAAYDPTVHAQYGYSKSLQIKLNVIQNATQNGIAFHTRKNDETVVVFYLDDIVNYLDNQTHFHQLTSDDVDEISTTADLPNSVRQAVSTDSLRGSIPELLVEERKKAISEVERFIRSHNFAKGIKAVYDRCAICGFQYDYILDAAHIVPVAEGGTDTYDNGLGLCPNCHRMYDNGQILITGEGQIFLNPHFAELYEDLGRAGSLENLHQTLRKNLWLPGDEQYHPSPQNLQHTFEKRRKN